MAKYYIKEESLTSIADSIRNIYEKTGKLTCGDMAGNLSAISDEVNEQSELVDKIARKFFVVDEDAYLEGNLDFIYNSIVTSVRNDAFYNCDSLTTVNLPNATSIGDDAFYNCNALASINLPSVTSIGEWAFESCTSLTSINLPNAISIGNRAFYNCDSLTLVDLPNATSIGYFAFQSCTSLTTVDLPNATSIGYDAFRSCPSLTSVIIRTNTVCTLPDAEVFFNTPIASGTGYIYVPAALIEQYKKGQYWRTYASQFRAIENYPDICGTQEVEV